MQQVRWGIIGCGQIAHTFAKSIGYCDNASLSAVGSTSADRARTFAATYNVRAHSSYADIVADPDIDAIYIANTHDQHFTSAALCLSHGKHVLCEKPITVNAQQLQQLINLATKNRCFLMEGVWMRFLPAILRLQALLKENTLGEIHNVTANFSLSRRLSADHRLMDKSRAGGALLDLGIYPISIAAVVFGRPPVDIKSMVYKGATDVDERGIYLLDYGNGQFAQLSSALQQNGPTEACILGREGFIRLPDFFVGAQTVELHLAGKAPEIEKFPFNEDENFRFEIDHATQSILQGQLQSTVLPLAESLNIVRVMDKLRSDWGVQFPAAAESATLP